MEICVEFDGTKWAFSPDPAVVDIGTSVTWKLQANALSPPQIRWTVYFDHGSPFRTQGTQFTLTNSGDEQIRWFISLNEASPELKAKLKEALEIKSKWDGTRREIQNVDRRINTITQDQNRLRQNLREMPKEAEAYKTYLKKFDEQEKEMTSLHDKLKNLQTQEEADRAGYENYLANLTVE